MSEVEPGAETNALPRRPGERLHDARVAQGLDLGDVAARTRIPQRHLESIEAGAYANLPSTTYAIGFARAYARAVGIDEVALAADVRAELGQNWDRPARSVPAYAVEDPSRQPSRGLVLGGVLVAVLLLIGVGLWYGTNLFRGQSGPSASETVAVPIPETVAPAPIPTPGAGQVAITATDEVWVHISDAAGQTLLMKTMAPGERFDVPADANGAKIEAGRPDKLAITVNGAAVPPLGDGRTAIKDVSLSPASLLARGGAAPAPAASPTPSATPTSRPSTTPTTAPTSRPTPRPTPSATPSRTPSPVPTPTSRPFEPAFGNSATPL